MMKKLLVDTDILIDFLKGREDAKKFLLLAVNESIIYCSAITVAEIHAGMRESEREKTKDLIDGLDIVDITREIAEKAGSYKRDEKRQSLELDDCLIAATASIKGAILATGNGKHYPMKDIKKEIINL